MANKKTKPVELPRKYSALLRLAVKDCKRVEKLKSCILDMRVFHTVYEDEVKAAGSKKYKIKNICHVCMAGAVMHCTLGVRGDATPLYYEDDEFLRRALVNVDYMRTGLPPRPYGQYDASWSVSPERSKLMDALTPVRIAFNRNLDRAPWEAYLEAADLLEKAGF